MQMKGGASRGMARGGLGEGGASVTGEVFLQRREQVPDHRDAPRPSQESLPGQTTHVGHVRVVDGKSKHPERGKKTSRASELEPYHKPE